MIYIICLLIIYLGYREYLYAKTIKDLSMKIMAKDVQDYSALTGEPHPAEDSDLVPIEDMMNLPPDKFLEAVNGGDKGGNNGKKE